MKRECERLDKPGLERQKKTKHCDLGRRGRHVAPHEEGLWSVYSRVKKSILGIPKSLSASIKQIKNSKKKMVWTRWRGNVIDWTSQDRKDKTRPYSVAQADVPHAREKGETIFQPCFHMLAGRIQHLFNNYSTTMQHPIQQLFNNSLFVGFRTLRIEKERCNSCFFCLKLSKPAKHRKYAVVE